MGNKLSTTLLLALCMMLCGSARPAMAGVRLPKVISDCMVLQRDRELRIWGWADPGEKVTVRFDGKHYFTEASSEGDWSVTMPPHKYLPR